MSLTLDIIVAELGGRLHGDGATLIQRIAPLAEAGSDALSFVSHPRYRAQLAGSTAACVIVAPALEAEARERGACIVTPDPYLYFARVTRLWRRSHGQAPAPGIHPSAVVDPHATVHPSATIGPLCVVERGAVIGAETVLRSRVSIGEDCSVGVRCLFHSGVVVGADGFGFAPHQGQWEKIEQLGAVRIGDDVEIGANTCIDRGALGDTVIEDGVKLDNLIQIGHNVRVGQHTVMAGCVGVAGSADIGAHCMIGGGAGILGHLRIVDGVTVTAMSLVTRSILKPGEYSGVFPLDDNASWEKNAAVLRRLHGLRQRVVALENAGPDPHNNDDDHSSLP